MNVYKFDLDALCPVDGTADRYAVTVKAHKIIQAELLNEVIERWTGAVMFQEAITKRIRRDLEVKCRVKTVGVHSGVTVIATRGRV